MAVQRLAEHKQPEVLPVIEIIAEIGVNHDGSFTRAIELIDAAKDCGCDTVKFQLWSTERVYPRERWSEMKALEFTRAAIAELKLYCDRIGIGFLCTPDELDDAVFLKSIGCARIKTSSQDVTNTAFLRGVAALGLPMIVSTGAASMPEVRKAHFVVSNEQSHTRVLPITLLHCVSAYPAPLDQMNLRVVANMRWFNPSATVIGLSDHTIGTTAALLALALGATVFEKHLTHDVCARGPDHAASANPALMKWYVAALREAERALGDGNKRVMPCEVENRKQYEAFIAARKGK